MQDHEFKRPPERDDGAPDLADRLDALSMESVERVLRRAIELQFDDEHGPDTLNPEHIERIAQEIGISSSHVRRALFEEATASEQVAMTPLDRFLAPVRMKERTIVEGDLAAVANTVDTWLEKHEGLQKRRLHGHGIVWEKDPSPVASIRMGFGVGKGTGAMRSVGPVTNHLHSVEPTKHLVTLEADTSIIGKTAKGLLAAGVGLSVVLAVVLLIMGAGWAALAGAAGALALFSGAAITTAKVWANRVRKGLARALDAIRLPQVNRVHETILDRIERAMSSFRGPGGRRSRRRF
ncbi:MAG: hypothetical protein OEX97_09755 [Acidimicrobiia bacterium]|nr:hypothetical protein [Acidimicrobiia bacterium]